MEMTPAICGTICNIKNQEEKHMKIMFNAKEKQPEDEEVVLVKLETGIFEFAHYDSKTEKWYGHETSSPAYSGMPCTGTVVSWMYLPRLIFYYIL